MSAKLNATGDPSRRAPAFSDVDMTSSGFGANVVVRRTCIVGLRRIIALGAAVSDMPKTKSPTRRSTKTLSVRERRRKYDADITADG